MKTDKKSLRQFFKAQRALLSEGEVITKSKRLGEQLISALSWGGREWVHSFMPIPGSNEVHTPTVLDILIQQHPGITLLAPRVAGNGLETHLLDSLHGLQPSSFGVPEPPANPKTKVHPATIDVILVPLLAHDLQGHRVGYGAGFYDRFLASCRSDAITIGLSFFPPVEHITDLHRQDVPLKLCLVA